MSKANKVLIYVEGESEVVLFKQYLNKYIKDSYNIQTECQKGDISSFKRKVGDFYNEYKEIFVLRDLKTQKTGYLDYKCITDMKNDFTTKKDKKFIGNIGRSYKFIVVCNEIESWALTCKRQTNNRNECHYKELFTDLNCGNKKPPCMKKYVDKLKKGELIFDTSKNKSFKYFLDELNKCK